MFCFGWFGLGFCVDWLVLGFCGFFCLGGCFGSLLFDVDVGYSCWWMGACLVGFCLVLIFVWVLIDVFVCFGGWVCVWWLLWVVCLCCCWFCWFCWFGLGLVDMNSLLHLLFGLVWVGLIL